MQFWVDFCEILVPRGSGVTFWSILDALGAIWNPRPKKSEKQIKNEPQMETFLGPLPSSWPLGGSFEGPGGQKERPGGIRGRFCGHHKNIDFSLCL